jgi:hypothetical protein
MRISEYPPEELQEWLNLPATRGFIEELDVLVQSLQGEYLRFSEIHELLRQQGKELGVWQVKQLIQSLGEGL